MLNPLVGQRLLVVEDEMMILFALQDILADLGFESVTVAASVDEALSLVVGQEFDIAMLDVNLNGAMSYPIADALAARGIPFVFATGYGSHGIAVDYRTRPILNKPYKDRELLDMFTLLLSHKQAAH